MKIKLTFFTKKKYSINRRGATVIEFISSLYNYYIILDFSSLHLSVIITCNIYCTTLMDNKDIHNYSEDSYHKIDIINNIKKNNDNNKKKNNSNNKNNNINNKNNNFISDFDLDIFIDESKQVVNYVVIYYQELYI
ncbi:hypothetical protein BCR32DRAFT_280263 [Anaeromyces robustus]|uniref:DNA-directed DNA polymerase n=1 Tax=Anaeromyces robustus TaxID=1754192 RepID=A0A1Y1X548_9FUNG|nr:hypothetical protein BCR32DRAFT_280263 [Anaeromyces robustus]|eukprot:ORX80765.1 hypothetical protein BCR32DRAFT_280263 [Anaeromyces robustus]